MADPGPLVGRGRAADVYDVGHGRVLRRYRTPQRPGQTAREAHVMEHVRRNGYPAPTVYDVDGDDLVMTRVDGPTVLGDLEAHPWRVDDHATTWARVVRRLADVPVGDLADAGLTVRFGPPTAVVHLDLHPDNIILAADGPVVIDWTNACLGPPATDVANGWIVVATSTVDGSWWLRALATALRRRFVERFLRRSDRDGARALLPAVAEHRLADPHVRPEEAVRVSALRDRVSRATRTSPSAG